MTEGFRGSGTLHVTLGCETCHLSTSFPESLIVSRQNGDPEPGTTRTMTPVETLVVRARGTWGLTTIHSVQDIGVLEEVRPCFGLRGNLGERPTPGPCHFYLLPRASSRTPLCVPRPHPRTRSGGKWAYGRTTSPQEEGRRRLLLTSDPLHFVGEVPGVGVP